MEQLVNSDNNHNEHVKKTKKNKLRTFVLIFVLSSFVTLIAGSVEHGRRVLYTKWLETEPAYDLFEEHLVSLFAAVVRPKLYNWGLDYDNWLQILLKDWHHSAYESALEKIPEEDGERLLWWAEYEFLTSFKSVDKGKNDAELMQKVMRAFHKLQLQSMASPKMEKIDRYLIGYFFLHHFVFNKNPKNLSKKQYLMHTRPMITTTVKYLENIDSDAFLNEPRLTKKIIPLYFYRTAYVMLVTEFQNDRFECNGSLIQHFVFVKKGLYGLFESYKDIEMGKERNGYNYAFKHYNETLLEISKIVKAKCNIDI